MPRSVLMRTATRAVVDVSRTARHGPPWLHAARHRPAEASTSTYAAAAAAPGLRHVPAALRHRLDNVLAALHWSSRRGVDKLVAERLVSVNGALASSSGLRIANGDVVHVAGRPPIAFNARTVFSTDRMPLLFVCNKPPRTLVTHGKAPQGGDTFFERLERASSIPRNLLAVGRLAAAQEGLILLTDSGRLQRVLEMSDLERVYEVQLWSRARVDAASFRWLKATKAGSASVELLHSAEQKDGSFETHVRVSFKGRQSDDFVKALSSIGLATTRMERVRFGPWTTKGVGVGQAAQVSRPELILDRVVPSWRLEVLKAPPAKHAS